MAHFAKLNEIHEVIEVVVVNNEVLLDADGIEQEELGILFLRNLYQHSWWVQTSYNSTFRGHYAGNKDIYNKSYDVFISPQPYPSWTLNTETGNWVSPVEMPEMTETTVYKWDESVKNWTEIDLNA
jgi:hypothetical protein